MCVDYFLQQQTKLPDRTQLSTFASTSSDNSSFEDKVVFVDIEKTRNFRLTYLDAGKALLRITCKIVLNGITKRRG